VGAISPMTPLLLLLMSQDYVLLSDVAKEVAAEPAFVEKLSEQFGILGPDEINRLRGYIRDKQWKALDSFPGLTIKTLGRSIRMAGRVLPKSSSGGESAPGPKDIGFGLQFGDELLPVKDNSVEWAARLNQTNPKGALEELVKEGHSVEIHDRRYFANFGDLKYKGREVLTPFWLDTGIPIDGESRTLLVPAPHTQYEIFITGHRVNAKLCFYFGIDGKAIIRPIDTKDQAWILGHTYQTYKGEKALEAMRIIGEVIRVYAEIQRAHPELPFGGYFALGVCNDPSAIVEMKLTGKTTLYPLTHDKSLFEGYGEVSEIVARLPQDEQSTSKERVVASLPVASPDQLNLAGLRADIARAGQVSTRSTWYYWLVIPFAACCYWAYRRYTAKLRNEAR